VGIWIGFGVVEGVQALECELVVGELMFYIILILFLCYLLCGKVEAEC
jgi:hypothetical protein